MSKKLERSIHELYANDAEDAIVFGWRRVDASRRGFLGGAGLVAMGAAVGGTIPFAANLPAGLIPTALAQDKPAQPAAAAAIKGPQLLQFPGKDGRLVVLGDRPLVTETPEQFFDDDTTPTAKLFIRNNGQLPDAAKEPDNEY